MGPKKPIPSIKRRPKAAVLGINDKFLIISNKIEDEINKNNNFTSDIQPINIDKSYRIPNCKMKNLGTPKNRRFLITKLNLMADHKISDYNFNKSASKKGKFINDK